MLADGATLAEILPGVTVNGQDVGTWLQAQRAGWECLSDGQRERLAELDVEPLPATEVQGPEKGRKGSSAAFERGVAALAQYLEREGHVKVGRAHVETVTVSGEEHAVKLGVFLSNTKTRRSKLTADKLQQLAELGVEWA